MGLGSRALTRMYVLVVLKLDRRIVDSKGDVKMETNAKSNDGLEDETFSGLTSRSLLLPRTCNPMLKKRIANAELSEVK